MGDRTNTFREETPGTSILSQLFSHCRLFFVTLTVWRRPPDGLECELKLRHSPHQSYQEIWKYCPRILPLPSVKLEQLPQQLQLRIHLRL